MVLDNIFLLTWPPILAIAFISVAITVFVTLIYKYTTNQKKMKELKDSQKELQKEYKKNMSNQKKAMEINQKLMKVNMEYMKQSFRVTLYTFIPLIIIFSWMNSHFGFEQIAPGQVFSIVAEFKDTAQGSITIQVPEGLQLAMTSNATQPAAEKVVWKLKGVGGEYIVNYTYNEEFYQQKIFVTNQWKYEEPIEKGDKNSDLKQIEVGLESTKPIRGVPILGGLNWLWTYIIISILGSIFLRKLFKVY